MLVVVARIRRSGVPARIVGLIVAVGCAAAAVAVGSAGAAAFGACVGVVAAGAHPDNRLTNKMISANIGKNFSTSIHLKSLFVTTLFTL